MTMGPLTTRPPRGRSLHDFCVTKEENVAVLHALRISFGILCPAAVKPDCPAPKAVRNVRDTFDPPAVRQRVLAPCDAAKE